MMRGILIRITGGLGLGLCLFPLPFRENPLLLALQTRRPPPFNSEQRVCRLNSGGERNPTEDASAAIFHDVARDESICGGINKNCVALCEVKHVIKGTRLILHSFEVSGVFVSSSRVVTPIVIIVVEIIIVGTA